VPGLGFGVSNTGVLDLVTSPAPIPADEWLLPLLEGLLAPEALAELRATPSDSHWITAVRHKWTTDEAILGALAARFRMPIANLAKVEPAALGAVTEQLARRYRIVPLSVTESIVDIATSNPHDLDCERTLAFVVGRTVRMSLAAPASIDRRLDELYRPENVIGKILDEGFSGVGDLESITEQAPTEDFELSLGKAADQPVIRLVDRIIAKAIQSRASDIHLEPEEQGLLVRYRIDGVLLEDSNIPRSLGVPLVARIKIMAQLDIADRLRPQDGRARVAVNGARVDLRISTLPASFGEKVVIRILDERSTVMTLEGMGLLPEESARISTLLEAREGLILVTGPTGSGKTTTLYSMLRTVAKRGVNIVTVEDPVEYRLQGIVQVNVNEKTGLTFPAALRSILRQDPDVILVGEIRDRETAQIAVQAALTGHLVLTTLHTIDAPSSITRLNDLGIDPYKSASALKGAMAQRLVRRLCPQCKQRVTEPLSPRLQRFFPDGMEIYRAVGCAACANTGYRGRLALLEILVADHEIERRVGANLPPDKIAEAARQAGMRSLWESGVEHVRSGITTVDELLRVLEPPAEAVPAPSPAAAAPPPSAPTRPSGAIARPDSERPGRTSAPVVRRTPPPGPPSRRSGTLHAVPSTFDGAEFELVDDLAEAGSAPHAPVVLLVEDEEALRRVLRDLLERDGFIVHEAADGVAALDEIDRAAPDIIVLDLNLPRLDGYGVLRHLRAKAATKDLPVLVLTAKGDEDSEVRVFEYGASEYMTKPFRPRALVARLNAQLKRS
jgi:type II secretory ATPase GspE/PulE/Tfp pilus assembly ATPase PilB-like protein/CheY-like chemotaxis protein